MPLACLEPRLLLSELNQEEQTHLCEDSNAVFVSQRYTSHSRVIKRIIDLKPSPSFSRHVAGFQADLKNGKTTDVLGSRPNLPLQIRHLAHLFQDGYVSTRIKKTCSILQNIAERKPNEKTIVYVCFSILRPTVAYSHPLVLFQRSARCDIPSS